ncbi:tRNA1(Val) (adenine(37)-N6)-methyltransferase [Devosia sp.]|uniref:tRNA1(Val) (adenine(37)-N6)-methyltransferase n=1 Tax=Devosia sp. TaxID=1871048 RepID=UPI003BA93193
MSLDHTPDLVKQQSPTRDAFLGGRLAVSQPGNGFRAGLDSVLLGAAVSPSSTSLLDLGTGVGTAALVALADRPQLTATLCDSDAEMLALAALNLTTNGFAERARTLLLDVTTKGSLRAAAGLPADHFATVIANPPFFDPGRGSAPSPTRSDARHMPDGELDLWVKAAATHAAPGGEVIFIHTATALPLLLASFTARFGAITVLPLLPREGEAASRILIRGIKGVRTPFTLLAARALHEASGRAFRPAFDAIFQGTGPLIW